MTHNHQQEPGSACFRSPGGPSERLVLGTWGISGAVAVNGKPAGYSHVDYGRFAAVLDAAYEAGVRWIDVAPGYGGGNGIRRLARWRRERERTWNVVTKVGRPLGASGPYSNITEEGLAAELRDCDDLLGQPDVVLVKDPPADAFRDGTLPRLLRNLRCLSGAPLVGIATHRLDMLTSLGLAPVPDSVVQLEYHLLNRSVATAAVRAVRGHGWRVWAMQPLAYGYLGGHHHVGTRFTTDDWRSRIPEPLRRTLAHSAEHVPRFLPPDYRDKPLAEVALAWCLATPSVDRLVCGPRSVEQFGSVLAALTLADDTDFSAFVRDRTQG